MHFDDVAGTYCSPSHRMPVNSRNVGSKCVSMMRGEVSTRPYPQKSKPRVEDRNGKKAEPISSGTLPSLPPSKPSALGGGGAPPASNNGGAGMFKMGGGFAGGQQLQHQHKGAGALAGMDPIGRA